MKGLTHFESDKYYHIINHAVGSENLFRNEDNYLYFLDRYAHYTLPIFETYAYCLMPNHFHCLVRILPIEQLSVNEKFKGNVHRFVMQEFSNMLNGYAKAYNKRFERKGALFIDYTKRFEIATDNYFTAVVNYIHQNPVNHGFVKKVSDWKYSSYHAFLSNKKTKIMREEVLNWFGDVASFEEFHQNNTASIDKTIEY